MIPLETKFVIMRTVAALLLTLMPSALAGGQVVEPSIGLGLIGIDEAHFALTASPRIYLISRLSIDPEVLYFKGRNDRGTKTERGAVRPRYCLHAASGANCAVRNREPPFRSDSPNLQLPVSIPMRRTQYILFLDKRQCRFWRSHTQGLLVHFTRISSNRRRRWDVFALHGKFRTGIWRRDSIALGNWERKPKCHESETDSDQGVHLERTFKPRIALMTRMAHPMFIGCAIRSVV